VRTSFTDDPLTVTVVVYSHYFACCASQGGTFTQFRTGAFWDAAVLKDT